MAESLGFVGDRFSPINRLESRITQALHSEIWIDSVGFSLLEGKRVRFDVTHEKRPGFDIAYRKVQNMRPIKELDQAA